MREQSKNFLAKNGFVIIENIYSGNEIAQIIDLVNQADDSNVAFRKSENLFAIRKFLREIPSVAEIVFNEKILSVISDFLGENYFVVKSIYFDKPEQSNWFVSYHQDLTISVDKKVDLEHFSKWTIKENQFAVQPPIDILKNIFTIRIHLDDTNENNGALKVIPGSHLQNIIRPENIGGTKETETTCSVQKGGIMIMSPLLLHSSSKTNNNNQRRVIHIEFSNQELPTEIKWSERMEINSDR
jgi:ectoine hydroxylase-related dioxygenase (phytanoyl-CoA dioxygenase family)